MEFGPILRAMRRNKLRFGLIVAEVALTLAIVANCVNMIMTARTDLARPSGFEDDSLISVYVFPFEKEFQDGDYRLTQTREDLTALRALPGVASASNTRLRPWQGGGSSDTMRPLGSDKEPLRTQVYCADQDITKTLGISLIAGRGFDEQEVYGDPNRASVEVIVSKAYADLWYPEGDALGKSFGTEDAQSFRVVGIFDPFYNPYGWDIGNYATFFACPSGNYDNGIHFLVRTVPGQLATVYPTIEPRLLELHNGRNVQMTAIKDIKSENQMGQSVIVWSLNSIIALLLFVTAVGIVGLTSFTVTERTRQIGTRRALGASRNDILRYFLLENWVATTVGIVLGLAGAFGLNIVLVDAVSAQRLGLFVPLAGTVILWMTGLLAALGPAMRASRIAPAIATRNV